MALFGFWRSNRGVPHGTLRGEGLIDSLSSSIILLIASSSVFAIAISFSSYKRLISLSLSKTSISALNFAALAAASTNAREIL